MVSPLRAAPRQALLSIVVRALGSHWAAALALLLIVIVTSLQWGAWKYSVALTGDFKPAGGLAWTYDGKDLHAPMHHLFTFRTDIDTKPESSDLQLFDAAGALGPAHAAEAAISGLGGGRFCYCAYRLTFSTRDGKEPDRSAGLAATASVSLRGRIAKLIDAVSLIILLAASIRIASRGEPFCNALWSSFLRARTSKAWVVALVVFSLGLGAALLLDFNIVLLRSPPAAFWRSILVVATLSAADAGFWIHMRTWVVQLMALIWLGTVWSARWRFDKASFWLILAALASFVAVYDAALLLNWMPDTVFMTEDTPGYWGFFAYRTAGYPILLHVFANLPGGMHGLVLFQFICAGAANLLLAAAIIATFRSAFLAAAICLLLTIKQGVIWMHFTLMTDSLFFSCCTACLALAMMISQKPSWRRIGCITVVLGLATLLRPAIIGIVPGLALVAALMAKRRPTVALALAGAFVVGLSANMMVRPLVVSAVGRSDAGAGAMTGYMLMQSVPFLLTHDTPSENPALRDRLLPDTSSAREALFEAHDDASRYTALLHQGDDFLYGHALKTTCDIIQDPCRNPVGIDVARAIQAIGMETIKHDPFGMARLTMMRLSVGVEYALTGNWLTSQAPAFDASARGRAIADGDHDDLDMTPYRAQPTAEFVAPDTLGIGAWAKSHWSDLNRLTLYFSAIALAIYLWRCISGDVGPDVAAIGISSLGLISYNIMLALGQTAFGRYTDAVAAWIFVTDGGTALVIVRGIGTVVRERFDLRFALRR